MSEQKEEIRKALNQLMRACRFSGEIGTEEMFYVLADAMEAVAGKWDSVVGQSHRDGLCYDVNAWLADEIADVLGKMALESLDADDHASKH